MYLQKHRVMASRGHAAGASKGSGLSVTALLTLI